MTYPYVHGLAETELLQCLSVDNNRYDQPWHRLPIQWSIVHTDEYANSWLVATFASGWQEWCLVLMFMFFHIHTCIEHMVHVCFVFMILIPIYCHEALAGATWTMCSSMN